MWKVIRPTVINLSATIKISHIDVNDLVLDSVKYFSHMFNFRRKTSSLATSKAQNNFLFTSAYYTPTIPLRCYAKRTKDSGKKIKHQSIKLDLNSPETNEILDVDRFKSKMEHTVANFRKELTEQLILRVTLDTVASVPVETGDGEVLFGDIAQLQQKSSQLIIASFAQNPQYASKAKTAITKSGINVNPQIDGSTLFLPIQKVTREHREKLAKNAKATCDRYKDKLRDVQNSFQREVKSHKSTHSEDLIKEIQEYILLQTKNFSSQLDEALAIKQKELLNE